MVLSWEAEIFHAVLFGPNKRKYSEIFNDQKCLLTTENFPLPKFFGPKKI